jgi:glutamine amidotransferase
LKCALEKVGFNSTIGSSPVQLKNADTIVLPGVGNFSTASRNLGPLKEKIIELIKDSIPVLGICLGMQLFFPKSEEGRGRGLALLQGKNIQLPSFVKVPHMGWNTLHIVRQNQIFEDVQDKSYVYFVHSCYPIPMDKDIICSETTYGITFASAIAKQNIFGTQFHPEKSGEPGSKILRNLVRIIRR